MKGKILFRELLYFPGTYLRAHASVESPVFGMGVPGKELQSITKEYLLRRIPLRGEGGLKVTDNGRRVRATVKRVVHRGTDAATV